jgi:hypothetical protein
MNEHSKSHRVEPAAGGVDRRACLGFAMTSPLMAGLTACGGGDDRTDLQRSPAAASTQGAAPGWGGMQAAGPERTAFAVPPSPSASAPPVATAPAAAPATPPALGNPLVPPNPLRNYVFGPAQAVYATGGANVGVGEMVLRNVTTGSGNTAIGDQVLWQLARGINCTGVGHLALFGARDAVDCTAVGAGALQTMQTGVGATALGRLAANSMRAAENTTAIGDSALRYAISGEGNTSVGYRSQEGNLTGSQNVCVGALAGLLVNAGNRNVLLGFSAMSESAGSASENVAVGAHALSYCKGDANTAIGVAAGRFIESGRRNVFIGSNAGASELQSRSVTNSIAIGDGAYTTQDNQAVIGNAETDTVVLAGVSFSRSQLIRLRALIGE